MNKSSPDAAYDVKRTDAVILKSYKILRHVKPNGKRVRVFSDNRDTELWHTHRWISPKTFMLPRSAQQRGQHEWEWDRINILHERHVLSFAIEYTGHSQILKSQTKHREQPPRVHYHLERAEKRKVVLRKERLCILYGLVLINRADNHNTSKCYCSMTRLWLQE